MVRRVHDEHEDPGCTRSPVSADVALVLVDSLAGAGHDWVRQLDGC